LDGLKGNETVQIHTLCVKDRQLNEVTLGSGKGKWTFPNTEEELCRFLVFQDLWKKGNYLTAGSKFGGHYLAYPGDPLQYHAQYVVIVKSFKEPLHPLDIVSYGRLGVTVRKTPVLAAVSMQNSKDFAIHYYSIDWQGVT